MMRDIQPIQMRRIYKLLKDLNITEQKAIFVPQFTNYRTESVSQMTEQEAEAMCNFLSNMLSEKEQFETTFNETVEDYRKPKPSVSVVENADILHIKTDKRKANNNDSAVKMRRKILHILGNMGYTKDGKFDYERINALIENIGTNNPTKAKFNYLTNEELNTIVTQIGQIYKKVLKKK
jgi:ribosomal protein L16 Arg81 hydroxylase